MMKTYRSIEGIIDHFVKEEKEERLIDVESSQDSKRAEEPKNNDGEDILFGVLDWSNEDHFNELPLPFLNNFESDFIWILI